MRKVIILLQTFIIFSVNNANANENEVKDFNSILFQVGIKNSFINQSYSGIGIFGAEYNHSLNKNISLGLGINSSTIPFNNTATQYSMNFHSRYYFNREFDNYSSFYAQSSLGFSSFESHGKEITQKNLYISPVIGYEFKSTLGLTLNIETEFPLTIYNDEKKLNPDISGVDNLNGNLITSAKLGYSF